MKVKYNHIISAIALVTISMASCKKAEVTTFNKIKIPTSSPIQPGNITGFVKGTLLTGQTYTVTGDITVKKGDTLTAQPGAIVVDKNNAQFKYQGVLKFFSWAFLQWAILLVTKAIADMI